METKILLRANVKKYRRTILGILILVLMITVVVSSVMTIWMNSKDYIQQEMNRCGYGDLTIWVSGAPESQNEWTNALQVQLQSIPEVDRVGTQEIIYSEYQVGEQKSDSEGQLILYEPEKVVYRIFKEDLSDYIDEEIVIQPGEIYVPVSMKSMFGLNIGDTIEFPIARNNVNQKFVVKGFYEDPFMGSSMIGMKGFLVCENDLDEMKAMIENSGIDGLARAGYMFHLTKDSSYEGTTAQFNQLINERTDVQHYLEFSHSNQEIYGFMMTFQNVFTGLFMAFAVILLFVTMVILGHSIVTVMEQDQMNIGICKAIGMSGKKLRWIQTLQYLSGMFVGILLGLLASLLVARILCRLTLTTVGMAIPNQIPFVLVVGILFIILMIFIGFIWLKSIRIEHIRPLDVIAKKSGQITTFRKVKHIPLKKKGLELWLALKQTVRVPKRYLSVCMVAMLLVFITSMIGRINAWLGSDGKGLMDAFNPADLHIAAQSVGNVTNGDVENVIKEFTDITDQYMLGMPSVSVEGVDYTANVITDPERFHILQGREIKSKTEIVMTEYVAADLGISLGDTVSITGNNNSQPYTVVGIYQCANDMGENIGMSRDGYGLISTETEHMWCVHYFIGDVSLQSVIMQELEARFGGDIYLHENTWPGLFGILSAMKMLMTIMYVVVTVFVFVVTMMVTERMLSMEQSDMGIFRAIGFQMRSLRKIFSLRFTMVSLVGALIGALLGSVITDPVVASLLKTLGISNFSSRLNIVSWGIPVVVVVVAFSVFSWIASAKMNKMDLVTCITENVS